MEHKAWRYAEFPDYPGVPEGAARWETDGGEMSVGYLPNVLYAQPDGIPLHLQVLTPDCRNRRGAAWPCLVYVQGSAWRKQDVYDELPLVASLAKRGYTVAIAEYRHSGQAPFPAQIQDAKNAVRFLRANAAQYHVLPDEICVGGCSSGGHTAVFCALAEDGGPLDRNLFPGVSAKINAVVDYYGAVNLGMPDGYPSSPNNGLPESHEGALMGGVDLNLHPEVAARGSAISYITPQKDLPPMLLIHGTKDRTVNVRQSVELYETLRACGKQAELLLLGGADHGGPEFWTDAVCARVDAFLRRANRR